MGVKNFSAGDHSDAHPLPTINPWIISGFRQFIPGYIRKHFHSFSIHADNLRSDDIQAEDCVVVFANHASWWDPVVALYCAQVFFPNFRLYAPIDADALEQYAIFRQLGFFGIDRDARRGAVQFLRTSEAILMQPGNSIWLTPEGSFQDCRNLESNVMPGIGHLAARISRLAVTRSIPRVWFLPLAVEYPFWEERLPEILAWFGPPILVQPDANADKLKCQSSLVEALRCAQRNLAAASIARNSSAFEVHLTGRAGTWGLYDLWRRGTSWLRGTKSKLHHGSKLQSGPRG